MWRHLTEWYHAAVNWSKTRFNNNLSRFNILSHKIIAWQLFMVTLVLASDWYTDANRSLMSNVLLMNGLFAAMQFVNVVYESSESILERYGMLQKMETDTIVQILSTYVNEHTNTPSANTNLKRSWSVMFEWNREGHISWQKQYLFYAVVQTLVSTYTWISWGYGSSLLKGVALVICTPAFMLTMICFKPFQRLFGVLHVQAKQVMAYVVSKALAKIINALVDTFTINFKPVTHVELLVMYQRQQNFEPTIAFFKTVIVQSWIYYYKKVNQGTYFYVIDLLHRYQLWSLDAFTKSSTQLLEFNIKTITKIVTKREWENFLNPKHVNMIFEIYESKHNYRYITRLKNLSNTMQVNWIRFLTLCSLSTIHPILALGIDAYFTFVSHSYSLFHSYVCYVFGGAVLWAGNITVGSFLIVTSELITKPILEYVQEYDLFETYIIRTSDQWIHLPIAGTIFYFQWFAVPLTTTIFYLNQNTTMYLSSIVTIIMAWLSNFSILHIASLTLLNLVMTNGYHLRLKLHDENKKSVTLIENYINQEKSKLVAKPKLAATIATLTIANQDIVTAHDHFQQKSQMDIKERSNYDAKHAVEYDIKQALQHINDDSKKNDEKEPKENDEKDEKEESKVNDDGNVPRQSNVCRQFTQYFW